MSEDFDTNFVCHQVNVTTGEKRQCHYLTKSEGEAMKARQQRDIEIRQAERAIAEKHAAMMKWLEELYDARKTTMTETKT